MDRQFSEAELWQLTVILDELVRLRIQEAINQGAPIEVLIHVPPTERLGPAGHLSDEDIGWRMDHRLTG